MPRKDDGLRASMSRLRSHRDLDTGLFREENLRARRISR